MMYVCREVFHQRKKEEMIEYRCFVTANELMDLGMING